MGNHAIVSGTDALYEMELKLGTIIKIFPEYYFSDDSNGFIWSMIKIAHQTKQ